MTSSSEFPPLVVGSVVPSAGALLAPLLWLAVLLLPHALITVVSTSIKANNSMIVFLFCMTGNSPLK